MQKLLIDFLFPKECFGCGSSGLYLCSECLGKIKKLDELICPVCQQKAIEGKTHPGCQSADKLDGAISLYQYKGMLQDLIKAIKYRFMYDVQNELERLFHQRLKKPCLSNQSFNRFLKSRPLIIPVPLFWQRQNWRGFNQAEMMAKSAAKVLELQIGLNVVLRDKKTPPQANLPKNERLKNVKDVFSINPQADIGLLAPIKSVLLIDDVWTTGATLNECAGVLKKSGIKTVWGMTLAR